MAVKEEVQEMPILPNSPWDWEDISLKILLGSEYEKELECWRSPTSSGRKKYRVKWLSKPRAISQLILRLQEPKLRESALHMLSCYLFEKREDDQEYYDWIGVLLYDSCCTIAILIQELLSVYRMIADANLSERASMRLINVIILFQCIAANKITRRKLVESRTADLLIPLLTCDSSLKVHGNVRAVALSVFAILCQTRESDVIRWAIEGNMVEVCQINIETGNELTKVIGMYIIESMLQDEWGISYFFGPMCNHLLKTLLNTWESLVILMVEEKEYSPRVLFHIIRCYILLCDDARGHEIVRDTLPEPLRNGYFDESLEEFPLIRGLLQQLLLIVGKLSYSAGTVIE